MECHVCGTPLKTKAEIGWVYDGGEQMYCGDCYCLAVNGCDPSECSICREKE